MGRQQPSAWVTHTLSTHFRGDLWWRAPGASLNCGVFCGGSLGSVGLGWMVLASLLICDFRGNPRAQHWQQFSICIGLMGLACVSLKSSPTQLTNCPCGAHCRAAGPILCFPWSSDSTANNSLQFMSPTCCPRILGETSGDGPQATARAIVFHEQISEVRGSKVGSSWPCCGLRPPGSHRLSIGTKPCSVLAK